MIVQEPFKNNLRLNADFITIVESPRKKEHFINAPSGWMVFNYLLSDLIPASIEQNVINDEKKFRLDFLRPNSYYNENFFFHYIFSH